ncbi:MAG TPA: PKD domain-containing protein, partial [Flavisolibacter sp.]
VTREIMFTDASIANAGNIIKWTWDYGDGSSQVTNNNSPVSHSYGATGNYNVSLTVETDKGCVGPVLTKSVTIHSLPLPGFIMPGICLTDPYALFIDTSSIADGSGSQFTYSWNFGDPNANMANPNTSTLKDPQHKYIAVGTYDVTLTVKSNAGCEASLTKLFSVNGTQPQSIFSVNGGNQHCSNETVSITDHSIVDVGNLVRLEIYWDYANDPTIKSIHSWPAPGDVYSHDYPEFFDPVTKDVVIMMVAYSGDNCLHSSSQAITLKATPQINFSSIPGICADQEAFAFTQATLLNNLEGSGTYTGNGITNGMFDPQLAGTGIHTIRYTYQSSNGCSNYKEQVVNVYPVPLVDAGPDRYVLQGGNAVLAGSGSGNNINYSWSPATWLDDAGIAQPVVTPQDDMTYTLTVTSSDNCSASDQVVVKFLREPAIPNTFSPNGDGVHDKWVIKYLESYPGATVEIFNRYGQPVFKSVGYSTPWDGSYKGKPLPAGTYYYLINPKNGRKQMSGFVDIIR